MSQNPFKPPSGNQYQNRPHQNPSGNYDPAEQLKLPGIFLIIVSAISILNVLAGPFVNASMGRYAIGSPEFIGAMVAATCLAALHALVLFAGINMVKKTQLGLCRIGAIIGCIPICTPCLILGIPFSIWALVLIGKPEVQNSFRS